MSKKILFISLSVFSLCCFGVFLYADDALVQRYLNAANDQVSEGNYGRAFEYINRALGEYKPEELPQNIELLAENIYYTYLGETMETRDWGAFRNIKNKLEEFNFLSTERITRRVRTLNTMETQDSSWGTDTPVVQPPQTGTPSGSAGAAVTAPVTDSAQAERERLERAALERELEIRRAESEEARRREQTLLDTLDTQRTQRDAFESVLRHNSEQDEESKEYITRLILIVSAVLAVVIILTVTGIIISIRSSRKQKEQFEQTLRVVAKMARSPNERMLLDDLPHIYGDDFRIEDNRVHRTLPAPIVTEEEQEELKELARKCEDMGVEIDKATGRKNNSKNVAELVYKIAAEMGLDSSESMLYFAVAMVYDAGFLLVNPALLQATQALTDEQKYDIRNHVRLGVEQMTFVPDRYRAIFIDGVLMHHENMDGSGYPEGFSGNQIPLIARLIRVVESFIALISKRSYHEIFDKETAVNELKAHPELYDQEVVGALDRMI